MPKGFNLQCAAGKTARTWLQRKGGKLLPGQALVLLPIAEVDVNLVVCEADYRALKRGIEHLPPRVQCTRGGQ